ncbi:MAG: DUF3368 domain-containing protein, partial [Chitinophagales bacterium]
MHKHIIADTSCFIVLSKIEALSLLGQVYKKILVTEEVANEFGKSFPNQVEIKAVQGQSKQQILEMQIDKGEASVIALALETTGSTVILDDYKARKIAEHLGLNITGTIGVLIKAKQLGLIQSIQPLLKKIKTTDFR